MKQHINKVTAATCYYQLRWLRQIRRRVGTEVTTQLVLTLVTSWLDYCNSVLAALPQSAIESLQRVQNTATRLIFNLGRCEHANMPCLIQLHGLPIRHRITYKLCTLIHSVHIEKSPRYLADIVQHTSSTVTRCGLRSLSETTSYMYITPRLCAKFGERAFYFSGPASWNSLPAQLRAISHNKRF